MTHLYKSAYAGFAFCLTLAACTPSKPPTDGATAAAPPPAPAQADIVPPATASGPAAPNTPGSLVSTSPADPAPPAANTPSSVAAAPPQPPATPPTAAELDTARAAFARTCAICHGPDGKGGPTAGEITVRDIAAIKEKMVKGKIKPDDKMLPLGAMLSEADMDAVAKYVAAGLPPG